MSRSGVARSASQKPTKVGSEEAENALTSRFPASNLTVLAHLYRGELYRANSWRMRLDNTTNWAVITTAGQVPRRAARRCSE